MISAVSFGSIGVRWLFKKFKSQNTGAKNARSIGSKDCRRKDGIVDLEIKLTQ